MYVIGKKIEIFFCRVDTAWRIIEQDTSSSYTDLECLGLVMPYIPCGIIIVLYTVEILLFISRNRTAVPISPICIKITVRSVIKCWNADWTSLGYFYQIEDYHPSVDQVIVQPNVDRVVQ